MTRRCIVRNHRITLLLVLLWLLPVRAEDDLAGFYDLFSQGNDQAAAEKIAALVEKHPENEMHRLNQAALAYYRGEYAQAWELLLRLDPADEPLIASRIHWYQGLILLQDGNRELARLQFRSAWEHDPDFCPAMAAELEILYEQQQWDDYRIRIRRYSRRYPDSWICRWHQGRQAWHDGKQGLALANYAMAISEFPHPLMLAEHLEHLQQAGHTRAEIEHYRQLQQQLYPERTEDWRQSRTLSQFFPPGVEYVYEVTYGFFTLGYLRILTEEITGEPERKQARVRITIDSNPLYRWLVDLHDQFLTDIRLDGGGLLRQKLESLYNEDFQYRMYRMDPLKHTYQARGNRYEGDIFAETRPYPEGAFEGVSLVFGGRLARYDGVDRNVITLVNEQFHQTYLQMGDTLTMEVMGEKKRVTRLYGRADYAGEAGMTGEFEGWFTADSLVLPVAARFAILVGSVRLTLTEINPVDLPVQEGTPKQENQHGS